MHNMYIYTLLGEMNGELLGELLRCHKRYVFREIVKEPKTIREIAEAVGMPYVTVRKYMK